MSEITAQTLREAWERIAAAPMENGPLVLTPRQADYFAEYFGTRDADDLLNKHNVLVVNPLPLPKR